MKLSIITINYNNLDGLRKTIDSVINQTWQDFEWIIVDGGSTDGSHELIKETAAQLETQGWSSEQFSGPEDPASYFANLSSITNPSSPHRLSWCSEKDKGIYNAMNKGIVRAKGEYCLFLNSGDCLFNDKALNSANLLDLSSDFESFDMVEDQCMHTKYVNKVKYNSIPAYYLIYGALPHQSTFINRKLFETIGLYDEKLKIVADWKFEIVALLFNGATFAYHSIILSQVQPNGVSKVNIEENATERRNVLMTLFPESVLKDYEMLHSFIEVYESSSISRKLYALLYRFADWQNKRKNK